MENKSEFQLSQAAFEALAENALDAIMIVNAQAICIYANRAHYQLFGGDYEKKEYLGTSGTRFWREQDLPFLMETIVPQAMAGGWSGEVKNLRSDGTLLDIQGAAFAIRDADGSSLGMAVTTRDITARKRLEAAAHESLERLNTVINNLPVVLFVLDRNGIFTLSEGKGLALTGNKPGRVVGMSAFDVYRTLPGVNDYLKRALDGEAFSVEIPMGPFIFDTSFSPVRDANGEFVGTIGLSMDITPRKKIEAETRRLVSVVETTPDLIAVTDLQGRVLYVNPSGLAMVGRVGQDFHALGIPDFHPPEVAQKIVEEYLPVVMQKGVNRWEAELLHTDGHRIPISQTASLIVGPDGKPEALTTTMRDITASKQAAEEARRLQEQVIEAQRHALQELSTPIIPVLDRIIVMPLIGSIDTLRAKDVTRALLAGISQYRAKIVIVDITGVPIVDSGVADHLNKTIQAARLKGAQTIVTGMSDAVAEAIIDLGIDWSGIQTLSDLQTGLMVAINTLGLKLSR
jgi:rsbT co-antagonist protein RsbR